MEDSNSKSPTVDEQLEHIVTYLHHLDRRDRIRTIGGFVRAIISILPVFVFLYSAWYLVNNWDKILTEVSNKAAASAAQYTKGFSSEAIDKLMDQYGIKGQGNEVQPQ